MTTALSSASNAAQVDYWNQAAGLTWARFQEQLDQQIAPLGLAALDALAASSGEQVIDIGCGAGQTTLALASRVGARGAVIGLDISTPLLEVARRRPRASDSSLIEFRQSDVQYDPLESSRYDAAFSLFGVMFFADPVAAFRNVLSALKPTGRLSFVCWRPLAENPWMHVPLEAARSLLPPASPSDPTAPGPFAFADPGRVRSILTAAGFSRVAIDSFDTSIGGADLAQTVDLALRIGPLGATLREQPDLLPSVVGAVSEALGRYQTPTGVYLPAAVWVVSAQRPG